MNTRLLTWFCLSLCAVQGWAADLRMLDVQRDGRRFHVTSELYLDAAPPQVFAALTDYDNLASLSSRFLESRSETGSDGRARVYTLIQGCVWFFCRSVERYAWFETEPPVSITATVDPQDSDFAYGLERWQLLPENDGTLVVYTHELEPRFWVPPLIGVWVIRRALGDDALKAATRIEKRALGNGAQAVE